MSKVLRICITSVLLFLVFMLLPRQVEAATIDPATIGNLEEGQSQTVKISGLGAGRKYFWRESKLTNANLKDTPLGYSVFFYDCYTTTGSELAQELGPFSLAGFYKLELYATKDASGICEPIGQPILLGSAPSANFSVGGPTGGSCCIAPLIRYNRDTDLCEDPIPIGRRRLTEPTRCTGSNPQTFCEPESLQCFKYKTSVQKGRVCTYDRDVATSDPSKYVFCAQARGKPCDPGNPGIQTAIGCIHTSPVGLTKDFLKFVLGISGGLAFLMMLLGAFQMLTSAGNPDTLAAGKDRLTSAVIGLLFVIFAVLLLQIIGVDILGILPKP